MLKLYSPNPHYFEFRGQPTLLIGSGEHYAAVLNTAFDYRAYLDAVAADGLNLTRMWSGAYREIPGEFGIEDNTLAPEPQHFICPWMQRDDGKFDLNQFNLAYFARLRDFLQRASDKGILVEFTLFCFWYNDALWRYSPMHPANTVQGIGPTNKDEVYRPECALMPAMEAVTRKLVTELNGFDNVYFEICNEVYSRHDGTDDRAWQARITQVITGTEAALPNKHLIAINLQNRGQRATELPTGVSVLNFHYTQPEAVYLNFHLNLPVMDDETGFLGQHAAPYRQEAWHVMLSGGAGISHLDYSYTVAHPDGSAPVTGATPGYGGADLRKQLAFLTRFLNEIEVWRMQPQVELLAWKTGPIFARGMADPGRCYAVYLSDIGARIEIGLGLPPGNYQAKWYDPVVCERIATITVNHAGGYAFLPLPVPHQELALALWRIS